MSVDPAFSHLLWETQQSFYGRLCHVPGTQSPPAVKRYRQEGGGLQSGDLGLLCILSSAVLTQNKAIHTHGGGVVFTAAPPPPEVERLNQNGFATQH